VFPRIRAQKFLYLPERCCHDIADGLVVSAAAMLIMLATAAINPRLLLNDYPKPIQAQVPPRTPAEKKQGAYAVSR
jgi:hypothetical protein